MALAGPIFAIVTPFDDKGGIDNAALSRYLTFLSESGVSTVIVNGSTGEFPLMTPKERMLMLELCREHFKGAIIANVSSSSLSDVHRLVGHANGYADAILMLPHYYYANASRDGVREFIAQGLSQSAKPVYLYNFPLHTQVTFSIDDIAWITARVENVAGIKDSSGSIESALAFKEAFPNFSIFVGGDSAAIAVLQAGLDGSASGAGNACPEFLIGIEKAYKSGDLKRAKEIQSLYDEWNNYRAGVDVDEVSLVKAVLDERLGRRFSSHVRLPFREVPVRIRAEATEVVASALAKLNI